MSDFSKLIISKYWIKRIIKQTWIRWACFIICSLSLFNVMNLFSSLFWIRYLLIHYIFLPFSHMDSFYYLNVMNRIKIINRAWLWLISLTSYICVLFISLMQSVNGAQLLIIIFSIIWDCCCPCVWDYYSSSHNFLCIFIITSTWF